jgi:LuxR family transcriptional regulator, maltose regulon positive regulatory protein
VLFWTYVIAALRTQLPGIGEAALAAVGAGWRALREAAIPLLLNDLLAQPDPVVLVLDDYHVISNPQVHTTLALLLERMPHRIKTTRAPTPAAKAPDAGAGTDAFAPVGSVRPC